MATGPYKEHGVSLQRDTLSTPWGFRLQGGKDFKAPLTVQRVFVGSPADGVLHRGDIIVSIENHECSNMMHRPAQDIIKQAGGVMHMRVRRGVSYVAPHPIAPSVPYPAKPASSQLSRGSAGPIPTGGALAFVPKPRQPTQSHSSNAPAFGTDYSKAGRFPKTTPSQSVPGRGTMLSKVQQSLNAAIWQPGMYDEPDYDQRPVHDLRQQFQEPPRHHQQQPQYHQQQPHHHQQQQHPQQGYTHRAPRHTTSHKPPSPSAAAYRHVAPPLHHEQRPAQNVQNEDDEDVQRSVKDLKGVFTEKPERPHERLENLDDYETKSVRELKKVFGAKKPRRSRSHRPPPPPISLTEEGEDSRTGYLVKPWTPPEMAADSKPLYQPGWQPKPHHHEDPGWSPVKGPNAPFGVAPGVQRQAPPPEAPPAHRHAYEVPRIEVPSSPAWAGSLKSMGGVKPWEVAAAAAAAPHEARPAHTRGRGRSPQPHAPAQQQQMPSPRSQQQQRMPSPHDQHPQMSSPQEHQRQMPSPQGQQQQMPSPRAQQQHMAPPQESQQPQRRRTRSPQPDYVPVHQPRVQNVHYGPGGGAPEYQQHAPEQHEDGDAKVAHLQYNSPLGLYSRGNVEEVLTGQTAGKPGEGTMIVSGGGPPPLPGQKQFDPAQSSVLRMLQEQEAAPAQQPQHPDHSARYQEHDAGQEMQYQGYMDHQKQSPSMHALECNMSTMDVGTSDF